LTAFAYHSIILEIILVNTFRTLKDKADRYHILFPMGLVKWVMEGMGEAEHQGNFSEVYENERIEFFEQQKSLGKT